MPLAAPMYQDTPARDYALVERAIQFIESQAVCQPSLEAVAAHVGLSPFHFQRIFTRWAGISPKRFLQFVTLANAKSLIEEELPLLDVAYEAGLSGTGRLHDLFIQGEAVTPGDFRAAGKGVALHYGIFDSPFGSCFIAVSDKGICELTFGDMERAWSLFARKWKAADIQKSVSIARPFFERIFHAGQGKPLPLHLRGTNFQLKVWQALLNLPEGVLTSYGAIARAIGNPKAVRAVGSAVGDNPIAWAIPCHRVLRSSGAIGGYATGTARKRAMLAWEQMKQGGEGSAGRSCRRYAPIITKAV